MTTITTAAAQLKTEVNAGIPVNMMDPGLINDIEEINKLLYDDEEADDETKQGEDYVDDDDIEEDDDDINDDINDDIKDQAKIIDGKMNNIMLEALKGGNIHEPIVEETEGKILPDEKNFQRTERIPAKISDIHLDMLPEKTDLTIAIAKRFNAIEQGIIFFSDILYLLRMDGLELERFDLTHFVKSWLPDSDPLEIWLSLSIIGASAYAVSSLGRFILLAKRRVLSIRECIKLLFDDGLHKRTSSYSVVCAAFWQFPSLATFNG